MKTGIFSGISSSEYFSINAINKSGLDAFKRSPLHYYDQYLSPNKESRVETPSMKLGSAVHCAVLETKEYDNRYVVMPDGVDRRTKEGKQVFSDLEKLNKIILSSNENSIVQGILEAYKNSVINKMLSDIPGKSEQVILWNDPITGEYCKARADWISDDYSLIIDLKTTEDARAQAFSKSCFDYGYHRQSAWYLNGIENATGKAASTFIFLVIEKSRPYAISCFTPDSQMLEVGKIENENLLSSWSASKKINSWPGYFEEIQSISLPKWSLNKE